MKRRIIHLKGKKGLTVKFIITIVILIISLSIIIAFFANFPGRNLIDKETCHQSVLMRSLPSAIGENLKGAIKLNCKTEKIMIDYSHEKEINKRIANAMYDCWWMLGEGKLDFMPEDKFKEKYCLMCSKIEFSESVKKQRNEVTGFIDYIQEEKIQGKDITYLEYIFGEEPELHLDHDFVFDTDTEYVIIYSALKPGWIRDKWTYVIDLIGGLSAVIAVPFTGGSSIAIFTVQLAGAGALAYGGFFTFFTGTSGGDIVFSIVPYEADAIDNLGCTEFKESP